MSANDSKSSEMGYRASCLRHALTCFLAAFAALFLLAGCAEDLSSEQHVENASAALASEDYSLATIELKNALQKDPTYAKARLLLGEVYLANGEILAAEKELGRARELGASEADVLPALAQTLVALGKVDELNALSVDNLAGSAKTTVLAAQALAKSSGGNRDEALADITRALEYDPENRYAMATRARLYGARAEYTLMREQLEKLLALDGRYSDGWLLLGDVEAAQNHLDKAEEAYTKAIELAKNPVEARLRRAFGRIRRGDYDNAQKDVDKLMRVAPVSPSVNYAQGLIHFQRKEMQEAVSAFAVAEREKRRYPLSLLYAGIAHYTLGNQDQAAGYAFQFYNLVPDNAPGRKLLAAVLLRERDYAQAEEIIRPIAAAQSGDVAAQNLLANALLSQGKTDEAIDVLNKVAALNPESSAAQIRLGASLLIQGQSAAGVEKLEAALELDPEFQQADILLVLNYVRQGDYEQAIEAAQNYRSRNPAEVTPLNLLGRVYRSAGRDDEARAAFEQALKISAGDPAAHLNLALMAVGQGDLNTARSHYEAILQYEPDNLSAMLKLAELDARENNSEGMLKRLEGAVEKHPGSLQARIILARAYLATGRPDKVAVVFSELDEAEKGVPAVLNEMARAQMALGEYASAKYTLDRLEASGASSAELYHRKAITAAGLKDEEGLRKELERSVEADPDYIPSRLALARLYLRTRELAAASEQIGRLDQLAPDYPDVLLLKSALAELEGDGETSIELASRAYELLPNTNTMLNLSMKYFRQGMVKESVSLQEGWVADNPEDVNARRALAESYMREQKLEEAVEQYEEILARDDDNMIALNNLAWFMLKSDPQKALAYAKRAKGVSPDSPDILDTLALAYYHTGDVTLAREELDRALAARPDDPSMQYHDAMLAAAEGDKAKAKVALGKLLDSGKEFSERADAKALFNSL